MKDFRNILNKKLDIIRDLGYLGTSSIIGTAISAFFWLYLANLLGAKDYGEIQYYLAISGIVYLLASYGTPNTIIVYAAKNIKIHSTLFLISIIGGLVALLVLFGIFGRLDIGLIVLAFIIYDLAINYLLGKKEYSKYSTHFLIQKGLMLTLGLGFYHLFGPEGIIFGMALSYIHFTVIAYKISKNIKIDFTLLKSKSGFITNNYFESSIGGVRGEIDKIIIVPLLGFTLLGNYALAMQVYIVLMVGSRIVFKYLLPQDASGVSNSGLKTITILVSIIISGLSIMLCPIIIPQFFPEYVDAVIAIQVMSLAIPPATLGYLYTSKFLSLEKSRFVLIGRVISLTTLVVPMIILPGYFGIIGAAGAFVISAISQTSFFVLAKRKFISKN